MLGPCTAIHKYGPWDMRDCTRTHVKVQEETGRNAGQAAVATLAPAYVDCTVDGFYVVFCQF